MIKPFHNETDYQMTLDRAESLWGAKQDTPDEQHPINMPIA